MANALVRACSVLPFQAIITLSPSRCGGAGGAISTGRPLSNSAASSVTMRRLCGSAPGPPGPAAKLTRARALRLVAGPAEHRDVEHAAVAADEIVAVGLRV